MIIAMDGPAASGKGTLARRTAEHLGLACLDTGLLYRAVARDVRNAQHSLDDENFAAEMARRLDTATLDDEGLRLPGMGEAASQVARHPAVRGALLELQRQFARRPGGAVLDGRDIGTVVCPDADVKIFVTASLDVRARRRTDEQQGRGEAVSYERVREIIANRDARDSGRDSAPMRTAPDAVIIDTSEMTIEDAFAAVLAAVEKVRGSASTAGSGPKSA